VQKDVVRNRSRERSLDQVACSSMKDVDRNRERKNCSVAVFWIKCICVALDLEESFDGQAVSHDGASRCRSGFLCQVVSL